MSWEAANAPNLSAAGGDGDVTGYHHQHRHDQQQTQQQQQQHTGITARDRHRISSSETIEAA